MHHDELLKLAREAMRQRGLQPDFSPAVHEEAAATAAGRTSAALAPGTAAPLRDLRHLPWCSIDNDDSRDLDQLTVAQAEAGAGVCILIAIADVDALVAPGGAIDRHARFNTTSVYTAAGVFPMLPERLSTDLSSLNEHEDRAALVVEVRVGVPGTAPAGETVVEAAPYRALVRNHAQLTYDGVAAWLDAGAEAPPKLAAVPGLEAQLRMQDRAAQALREARRRHGALSLTTPEARPVFSDGVLTDLRDDEGNRAKELIAAFMIAANGVTARFLDAQGFPSLRRVLREPARWQRIRAIAATLGAALPEAPSAIALDAFLTQRRQAAPERFAELSLMVVKLLGSGEYMVTRKNTAGATGHFGLAVNDYTHSTAPNRRYPDLVTQRLIKAALAGAAPPLDDAALAQLAQHCTEQEDNAAKVERQVRKAAAALLLGGRIGERFDAIVTGVSPKGTWVRITRPVAEGRVVQGEAGLDVGDKLRVELVAIDAARGFIDFRRAG